jgi:mannose-1-phosphate guanylyltransferase/mannose-6-phosphate isomerase
VPLQAGWNDIGAWDALWSVSSRDAQGNAQFGDVLSQATRNSYLRAEYRLLAVLGVEDLIVVETADAVLVAHKNRAQEVKKIVGELKRTRRSEVDLHRKVFRPWGTYEVLDSEARFKVKRITVNPGASLSLQMHYHRSEHWIVVKGTARIVRENEAFILSENQSTYIPLGIKHRLENPGKVPLEMIEVQSGPYLGEDDIVRFEDHYRRKTEGG